MIKGLHHVAVVVPDIAEGLRFYRETLGFTLLWRSSLNGESAGADAVIGLDGVCAEIAMLKAGSAHVELWTYVQPVGRDRRASPCDRGFSHIALDVEDIDAEYERLSAAGMRFHRPPVDLGNGAGAIYGQDPFGNVIELYQAGES